MVEREAEATAPRVEEDYYESLREAQLVLQERGAVLLTEFHAAAISQRAVWSGTTAAANANAGQMDGYPEQSVRVTPASEVVR